MRQIVVLCFFLGLALPLLADEKEDAAKKLNGSYSVLSVMIEGKADAKKTEGVVFTIKDGKISVKEGDRPEETIGFTVDPSKKPPQIDLSGEKNQKDTMYGIYELKKGSKGAELTLALAKSKEDRPKDFAGEGKVMVVKLLRTKE